MTAMMDPTDTSLLESGVLILKSGSYDVVYCDKEIEQHYPAMRVGDKCYAGFGRDAPCPGCPVSRLGESPIALGTRTNDGDSDNVDMIAANFSDGPERQLTLVCYGRLEEERNRMHQKLAHLLRLSCDVLVEVNLDTGDYFTHVANLPATIGIPAQGHYIGLFHEMLQSFVDPADVPLLWEPLHPAVLKRRLTETGDSKNFSVQFRLKNDPAPFWIELNVILMYDSGSPRAIFLANDVTKLRKTERLEQQCELLERLWMNDERYRMILQQMHTIVFEHIPSTDTYFLSPFTAEYLWGNYDGRPLSDILQNDGVIHPTDLAAFKSFYQETLTSSNTRVLTLRLKCRDAVYRWYKLSVSTMAGEFGGVVRTVGTLIDVDKETKLRESLRYRAEYDVITGIFNKSTFFLKTKKLLITHPGCKYSIIRLDIDRFKMVNDLFGIDEGDKILRYIGQRIQEKVLSGVETYARLGDDVFCMCVARSDEEIAQLAMELDKDLTAYSIPFKIVPSIGIYRVGRYRGEPINVLCDRAGLAQKTVKGNFVTRYAFYEERMSKTLFDEQEIISEMHQGITNREFSIYLQPKYNMNTDCVVGAEALVRWFHPKKGLIPPSEFIPLFEKNGFINALDEYVWDLTCQTLRRWIDLGIDPYPISVNVSRLHLFDPKLCIKFQDLVEKYQLPPRLLELELTESAYVENQFFLREMMVELQRKGFIFLMDDFGSGYSSLNMLKNIPVNQLKIDLDFLRECTDGSAGRIILESVIGMAQRLHLPVIAEGVEEKEQAHFLIGAGCSVAQGYYYSKPIPVAEFEHKYLGIGTLEHA